MDMEKARMAIEKASIEDLQARILLLEDQLRDSAERLRREHMFDALLAIFRI